MDAKNIVGYLNEISVTPGDRLQAMVSTTADTFNAALVRLISGDDRPHGTGYRDEVIIESIGRFDGREQLIQQGSYAVLPGIPALPRFSFRCKFYPTLHQTAPQTLLRTPTFALVITGARLEIVTADQRVELSVPTQLRRWHDLELAVEPEQARLTLHAHGIGAAELETQTDTASSEISLASAAGDWILADRTFNGRMEAPSISSGTASDAEQMLGQWDFSIDVGSSRIIDISGANRHGKLFQTPTRAVKGSSWDGTTERWTDSPSQYAAIHFHDDDLTDAEWETDVAWEVPQLPSGLYALWLRTETAEDYLPFVIRTPLTRRGSADQPRIAFLAASATYLAYANETMSLSDKPARDPSSRYLQEHPEVGYSLYDYHRDGSGVHYSSRLRPVLNLRPKTLTWSFNADTNITAWLEQTGLPFDVISDEDLHRDGVKALEGYQVVLTGAHPEYYSTAMHDGLTDFLTRGGRLMYLGGNGFYWRIAYDPENPAIIEVRRAEGGTRAWMAEPGEYYHSFTGEYGGMWRRLGKPPNVIAGIGFAAQGFDGGTYYRLKPGAADSRAAFIFDGVTATDIIGDYGTQAGGAAGEEIDRWDPTLGSPEHALILASSENHRPGMLRVVEEFHMMRIPEQDSNVRADMVFFETPSGGAVFSTGSISFAGAFSVNNYSNDVERLTRNVLERFTDATPFKMPD